MDVSTLKKGWRYQRFNQKSKKDRHCNGQQKKDKRTDNDIQNITKKTKDRAKQIPLNSGASEG